MTNWKLLPLTLFGLAAWGIACVDPSSSSDPGEGTGTTAQRLDVAVFHTPSAVYVAHMDGGDAPVHLRAKVRDFYPAACLDSDLDGDQVPDTLDDDPGSTDGGASDAGAADGGGSDGGLVSGLHGGDDHEDDDDAGVDGGDHSGRGGEDDDHGDGGVGRADGGDDDDDDDALRRCKPCNRGPGNEGDFRLKIDGDEAELQRGRVLAREGNLLTVTPDGSLTIEVNAGTDLRDGQPVPGAEIRVKGRLVVSADGARVVAEELRVLCPGPGLMDDRDLPSGAHRLPGGHHHRGDGGTRGADAGVP